MTERLKTAAIVLLLAALAGSAAWAATTTGTTEVRIEARQLEDGRVEFALTQDGGERILPNARYFPANAEVGKWLRSTTIPLSVEVESDEVGDDPANDPPASTTQHCLDSTLEEWPDSICAGTWTNGGTTATSYVVLPPGRWEALAVGTPTYSGGSCSLWPENVDGTDLMQLNVGQWDGDAYLGEPRTYLSTGTQRADDLKAGLIFIDEIGCADWHVSFRPR